MNLREDGSSVANVPMGPPQDICGYEEHTQEFAWKIPTGISCMSFGSAAALFAVGLLTRTPFHMSDSVFLPIFSVGALIGLAFILPTSLGHSVFVKAHPFIEDF